MNLLKQVERTGELLGWQMVPQLVATRYKQASRIEQSIRKVIRNLPADPGYGYVFWNPDTKTVFAVLGDGDDEQHHQKWHNALKAIPGVQHVESEAEVHPPNPENWIRIKTAAALDWLRAPYQAAGKLTGGPSPMSNAIVSALIGGGLGYGGGALAEQLFPDRYVEKGRLRKTMGLMGAGVGAAMHLPQALGNMQLNSQATGNSEVGRSFLQGNQHQQVSPNAEAWRDHHFASMKKGAAALPSPAEHLLKAAEGFAKQAFAGSGIGGGKVPLRAVPVDAFNRAIWNDVHNGANSSQSNPYGTRSPFGDNSQDFRTPPVNAAAAAGLVTGVQQMYGNAPVLSPRHFIAGLANAGLDLATATVAGGILGTLGGLTPQAQQKIQDMGLWSGMIRGVTGSVLGLR
jgi:hypothetical protein